MRERKIDNRIERRIVTGLIVSDRYIKEVQPIFRYELLAMPFAKIISQWCNDYFVQYQVAPGIHIKDIFESNKRNNLSEEQAELIEDFLASISHEFEHAEKFNVDYLLDETERRFKLRSLTMLDEDLKALVAKGDVEEAERLLLDYKRIARPASEGINPFTDEDAIFNAFEESDKNELFRMPGALGNLLGPVCRDDFISIMAPEKRGKTWWLMEFAMRASRAKCNVAFFSVGDMSESQMIRRIHTYNTKRSSKYAGKIKVPVLDCEHNQRDMCDKRERTGRDPVMREVRRGSQIVWERIPLEEALEHIPCTHCAKEAPKEYKGAVWHEFVEVEKLTWQHAFQQGKKFAESSRKHFKLSTHPNSSVNVRDIEAILDMWELVEDFVPDLILIDYADILAPENPKVEVRHQINDTWKAGRALSQKRHCAVIWATQADAASYEQKSIRETNFSEDKRKYSHVTSIITLNQTSEEKRDGIMRVGRMFVREDDFDVSRHATVLQCLHIGRPYLGSYL